MIENRKVQPSLEWLATLQVSQHNIKPNLVALCVDCLKDKHACLSLKLEDARHLRTLFTASTLKMPTWCLPTHELIHEVQILQIANAADKWLIQMTGLNYTEILSLN